MIPIDRLHIPPKKPLCECVVIFCFIANKRGVDDEDLVVEVQLLDVHLQLKASHIFDSKLGLVEAPIPESVPGN